VSTSIQYRARLLFFVAALLAVMVPLTAALSPDSFLFIIIGDRTGEAQHVIGDRHAFGGPVHGPTLAHPET